MEKINCLNIFKSFFKIGLILLGGGYVIIPIMKDELIKKRNWIEEAELLDFYCISQCLPGIIAVNMAILVGYKLLKLKGAIVGLFSMILSPFISIVILAKLLNIITKIPYADSFFWGVNLSVIILIYLTLKDIWQKSIVDYFSAFWFVVILFLSIFKVSPAILIISTIILGIIIQLIKDIKK